MKILISLTLTLITFVSLAQERLPILKSNKENIDIRIGDVLNKNAWIISPEINPDIYEALITKPNTKVTFISDIDSISFSISAETRKKFIVKLAGRENAYTEIIGKKLLNYATFDRNYKKTHNGKMFVEIPEVYELFHVIMALTDFAKSDEDFIEREPIYYKQVIDYFDSYKNDSLVSKFDELLKVDLMYYVVLKMDAYTFYFDENSTIKKNKTYDRVSWGNQNTIEKYIPELEKFAKKTNFRQFYKEHQPFYENQMSYYRDSIGLEEMLIWLNKNFPSAKCNSLKVIFSPLTGYFQSANWFIDNNFKEAQAHVNFPHNLEDDYSKKSLQVKNGNIVFTEINHSYINVEAEKLENKKLIESAFSDLSVWTEKGSSAAKYYGYSASCFNEYMNWGLVSLRYLDYAPKEEMDKLLTNLENYMVKKRGFIKFKEFNQNLMMLYSKRKDNQTISDLYPQILQWCNENNL